MGSVRRKTGTDLGTGLRNSMNIRGQFGLVRWIEKGSNTDGVSDIRGGDD